MVRVKPSKKNTRLPPAAITFGCGTISSTATEGDVPCEQVYEQEMTELTPGKDAYCRRAVPGMGQLGVKVLASPRVIFTSDRSTPAPRTKGEFPVVSLGS